jgi:hypothetical protein
MSITLEGLSKQQYQIADLLWNCDSQDSVQQLMAAMPPEYRKDAVIVHQLMIAAVMDGYMEVDPCVKDLIDRCRS